MKALGRGLDIDRSDPISVRNGLQQFAHGAKTRMPLLKAAGFVPRDFAAVDAAIAEMNEIEADQTSRRAIKNTVIDRIFTLALAAEGYFRVYRARARLAAGPDDQLMTRLTAPLLRSEERRRAVVVKAQLPNGDPTK